MHTAKSSRSLSSRPGIGLIIHGNQSTIVAASALSSLGYRWPSIVTVHVPHPHTPRSFCQSVGRSAGLKLQWPCLATNTMMQLTVQSVPLRTQVLHLAGMYSGRGEFDRDAVTACNSLMKALLQRGVNLVVSSTNNETFLEDTQLDRLFTQVSVDGLASSDIARLLLRGMAN